MSKLFKLITILLIVFVLFTPVFVNATTVDMNLNSNGNTYASNTYSHSQTFTNTVNSNSSNSSTNSATISSLSELPEAGLGLTNILNIILIVVGTLLILLSIAILIRLKH